MHTQRSVHGDCFQHTFPTERQKFYSRRTQAASTCCGSLRFVFTPPVCDSICVYPTEYSVANPMHEGKYEDQVLSERRSAPDTLPPVVAVSVEGVILDPLLAHVVTLFHKMGFVVQLR